MYVVYEHWLNNKCFYVGSGSENRPFRDFDKSSTGRRSIEWFEFVENRKNEIDVRVVKIFDNKKDAVEYEYALSMFYYIENQPLTMRRFGSGKYQEFNENHKNKISKALKGKKKSESHKESMKNNHADVSGNKNSMYGKMYGEAANARPVFAHNNITGEELYCTSLKELYDKYFINICSIQTLRASAVGKPPSRKLKSLGWKITYEEKS